MFSAGMIVTVKVVLMSARLIVAVKIVLLIARMMALCQISLFKTFPLHVDSPNY